MAKRDPVRGQRRDVPDASATATTVAFGRRGAAMAAGCVVFLISLIAYARGSWAIVLFQLATDGAVLAVWLLAALGIGAALLGLFRLPADDLSSALLPAVTSIALGLGTIGLAVLGLGLAGGLNRITAIAIVAIGIALAGAGALRYRARRRPGEVDAAVREWVRGPAGWAWLWLLALPPLAMVVVGAAVPPGFLWNPDEPHGYDVVSYHLQVPREWYEADRVVPLRHNVFSYFPLGVEMHFLLAMHLRGGPWHGMYLAQLMHAAHVVLAVFAVYGLARTMAPRRSGAVFATVAAASVPWLALLAPIAYNEGGLLLYGTLAVGWCIRAASAPLASRRTLVLAGIMAGFACGTKLTGVPMLLLGVPAAMLVEAMAGRRTRLRAAVGGALVFVAAGALVFSPWLVRNSFWAGNPVFPEAASLLGKAHFTDVQVERWRRAHSPRPDSASPSARLSAFGAQVWRDWRFGYALLPMGIAAAAVAARRRPPGWWVLVSMLAGLSLFWLTLTHLQGRFFVLAVPIAALLLAMVDWGRWAPIGAALAVAAALVGWGATHAQFAKKMYGQVPRVMLLGMPGEAMPALLHPPQLEGLPPEAPLALIGDARAFHYLQSMKLLRYRTVFDVAQTSDIGPTNEAAVSTFMDAWRGRALPNEWLLVDPVELTRFSQTYFGIPPPPGEIAARQIPYVVTAAPAPAAPVPSPPPAAGEAPR